MNNSRLTIQQIHKEQQEGSTNPQKLFENSKTKFKELDTDINSFVEFFDDAIIEEFKPSSLLSGIPVGLKDNILVKGRYATASSKILEGYKASYDSFVVKELIKHGATIVGRLNMDDSAMGSSTESSCYGPTKNPLDLTCVPGGSSGGPAAAVAAGIVPYALGSDTGGSVRQPASLCGIVGLKPSYGAVSRNGLIALSSSLDVIGPLCSSVQDAKTVFESISAYDSLDSTCVPLDIREKYQEKNTNNKIIGVPRKFLQQEGIDKEVLENFEQGLKVFEKQGYRVIDIDIPNIEHSLAVYYIIQPAEASSNLARYDGVRYGLHKEGKSVLDVYTNTKSEGFGEEVKRRIMLGTHVLSSGFSGQYYNKAQALRNQITVEIKRTFNQVDIIATPTCPTVAFKLNSKLDPISMYLQDIFTVPYNLSGNPAISIPSGKNEQGLAFGMHLVAPMFCENKLFEVSVDFERDII